jgi:hypothetical protein
VPLLFSTVGSEPTEDYVLCHVNNPEKGHRIFLEPSVNKYEITESLVVNLSSLTCLSLQYINLSPHDTNFLLYASS